MLSTKFNDVLVCDVIDNDFEGTTYYSVVVYSNRSLIRVSLPTDFLHRFDDFIGCYVSFDTDCRTFDGKTKYKYTGNEISLSR